MISADPIYQQKMMTILMPVMFGFLFYKISSGLTLYLCVYYFLSTLTQWKIVSMVGK